LFVGSIFYHVPNNTEPVIRRNGINVDFTIKKGQHGAYATDIVYFYISCKQQDIITIDRVSSGNTLSVFKVG